MANLLELADEIIQEGYPENRAQARVCQDIVLKAIAQSKLSRNVTIKGGIVMQSISGDVRRATQDMDFDFIRYSLDESSIRNFIKQLNCLDGVTIKINGPIEELSQQEYHGKRVYITISDDTGHSFSSKIDLGVHANLQIKQEEYCFDICLDDEGASLLINSKEQIFVEKLRSLLRFGPASTRYKDIFDMCYLSDALNMEKVRQCMNTYIFEDPGMRENNIEDIKHRLGRTFSNGRYRTQLNRARRANWLKISPEKAFLKINDFLSSLT